MADIGINNDPTMFEGFMLNKEFPQPYVHRLKSSYAPNYKKTNPEILEQQALQLYRKQSASLREKFRANELPDSTAKEGQQSLETIDLVLQAFQQSSDYLEMSDVNIFKDKEYEIDGKSFWSYSTGKKEREALFTKSKENLIELAKKLSASIEAFNGISEFQRKAIIDQVIKTKMKVPKSESFNALNEIYSDAKADKGIKRLVAAEVLLLKYTGQLDTKYATQIPNISDKDASAVIRGLAGSLNNLKGGYFEIAVNELLNKAGTNFRKEIEKIGLKITGGSHQGDENVTSEALGGRSTTSKTDLVINLQSKKTAATMNVGLSLKTSTRDLSRKKPKRETSLHTGNLQSLMIRAQALVDDSAYHLVNSGLHHGSTSAIFRAAKMKTTAMLALDAVAGLGTKEDTAYFIMYTDKIVNISDYLDEIGRGDELPFNMSIPGVKGLFNQAAKMPKAYDITERYIRSKAAFDLITDTTVTLTSSSTH